MTKKAVLSTLVFLIIFIVGGIILLGISYVISNQIKEDADIETCRLSVLVQAQTRKLPVVPDSPKTLISLDCPRRNLRIFEDKATINGKKSRKYEFDRPSNDDINHVLAEELRLCWYKMAEGNQDVFENSVLFDSWLAVPTSGLGVPGGIDIPPTICLMCSEISFDDKLKGRNYVGLENYLKNKIPGEEITYFDYLVRKQPYPLFGILPWSQYLPWGEIKTGKLEQQPISPNEKYSVYFMAYKPSWLGQFTKKYTKAYFIGLGTDDKITEECDQLVN